MGGAGDDPVAEAGGEALDLGLDPAGHIHGGAMWHVAIGPGRRLAGRGPSRIPWCVLDEQDIRPVGMAAGGDIRLCGRDLVEGPAEVDGGRAARALGGPRNGSIQRPVHLEHAGSVAEALGSAAGPGAQSIAADRDELAGRHVEQDGARRWQVSERRDPMAGDELAAGRFQFRDEGVGDGARAAADHRPADRVRVGREDEPERSTQWAIETEHRVGRDPREQGPRGFVLKSAARQAAGRPQRGQPESGERHRVPRQVDDRLEEFRPELSGVAHERPEQPAPGPTVGPAKAVRGGRHRTFEDRRSATVEGVGDRCVRVDELDAAGGQVDRRKERRGDRERQDRGAHVVAEPGEGQLRGPGPAAGCLGALVDTDRAPGAGQGDGRGQAVRPGPNDDRVDPAVVVATPHGTRSLSPGRSACGRAL